MIHYDSLTLLLPSGKQYNLLWRNTQGRANQTFEFGKLKGVRLLKCGAP